MSPGQEIARPGGDDLPAHVQAAAWRRLDPKMLVVHPIRQVLRALPVLAGIMLAGSGTGHGSLWGEAGAGLAVLLGVLRWLTTSYRVAGGQLQVRRGLLQREAISVPLDRVRTVDISASTLHRMLGLVRVGVGTGRSDLRRDALRLDGLSAADAARLRAELLERFDGPAPAAAGELLAAVPPSWARFGPFTLSGFATVFLVLGVVWRIMSEAHLDPRRVGPVTAASAELGSVPPGLAAAVLALALLLVVAAASTAGYLLAFWAFRLVRTAGGTLQVSRGLVSTRSTTIEERRLRGVEISEPLLLRAVRGARCIAIATGLRVGRGAERGGTLLLPPGPATETRRVAASVLRTAEPVSCGLRRHGAAAHRRRYTRLLAFWLLVTASLVTLTRLAPVPGSTWQLSLPLLPLGVALAYDRYRSLGHALVERTLVTRGGSLVRRRSMVACDAIIGWNVRQSFFQRRAGLATLVATTAAGRQRYAIQDVPLDEAVRVAGQAVPGLLTPFLLPAPSVGPLAKRRRQPG